MKIIGLVGSNRDGNTLRMVSAALDAIGGRGQARLVKLSELSFSPCDGCLECDETGTCHFSDDMSELVEEVESADGLVLGTPTRWGLLSGELKAFLDRLNPLARPESLAGKKAIVLAVGQSEESSEEGASIESACASVATFCDNADVEIVDRVCAYGCLNADDILGRPVLARCAAAGVRLIESI